MCLNGRNILYTFDILGPTPKLLIFNNERYKSFVSSIISIIIIIVMVMITIIFIVQYFDYDSPIVSYSKVNDKSTNRSINLKKTLLIFQMIDSTNFELIDNSKVYFTAKYTIIYDDGLYNEFTLDVEPCEPGKNFNIKFKNNVESTYSFDRHIKDFYCLNLENNDINLFYQPNIGYSNIKLYINIREGNNINPDKMQTLIVNENSLIDHNNKDEPLGGDFPYYFTSAYSSDEYTEIYYNFQYIKYASDDGFFSKNINDLIGIYFSDMYFIRKKKHNNNLNEIGVIIFGMNKSNYDYYQRTYKRLQTLLAEIMSTLNLILEIWRIIMNFLSDKKMSCRIIRSLMNKGKNKDLTKIKDDINKLSKSQENNKMNSLGSIHSKVNKSWNIINKQEMTKSTDTNSFIDNDNTDNNNIIMHNKVFTSINYFHIIKSYLGTRDKRTKLINHCHKIINNDLCIENILQRFYYNETVNNYLLNKNYKKIDYIKCDKFQLFEKYLYDINEELKKNKTNIKNDKTTKK